MCYNNDAKTNLLRGDFFFPESKKVSTFSEAEELPTTTKKYACATNEIPVEYEAYGKIHCDIFNINKYMLNNIDIKLVFSRSTDNFCLFGEKTLKANVSIRDTFLRIRRVKISNAVMLAHAMALEQTTAKYPIKRVLLKPFVIPNSSDVFTISGIHFGIMPTRVVVGFVKTSAYGGTIEEDPFYFHHIGVTYINLKVASRSIPYAQGIRTSYYKDNYTQGYLTLHKNIREASNGITYENYKTGNTLYAFDLTPDLCSADHFNLLKDGSLDLDVHLEKDPKAAGGAALVTSGAGGYTAMFYLEFDNIIEITKERQVLVDYKL